MRLLNQNGTDPDSPVSERKTTQLENRMTNRKAETTIWNYCGNPCRQYIQELRCQRSERAMQLRRERCDRMLAERRTVLTHLPAHDRPIEFVWPAMATASNGVF
jgi:hypothetical protein